MSVKIFNTSDSEKWNSYLQRLPNELQHVHYTPEYHRILEKNGDGRALLFIFEYQNNFFFYPFMLREINKIGEQPFDKDYRDIKSVFGYTGPLAEHQKTSFLKKARQQFLDFCNTKNVISELIRYNPLLKNHQFTDNLDIKNIPVKEYVYVDLSNGINEVFSNYRDSLRNIINQGDRDGLSYQITKDKKILIKFFDLYKDHMQKIDVDDYYLFSDDYFDSLADFIDQNGFLIYSRKNQQIKAGHMFLGTQNTIYNHHSARNMELENSGFVNKYLYHKAFEHQIDNNYSYCLLGGGATDKEDDGLLQFKKHFSHKTVDFVIGKKVINNSKYAEVVDIWKENHPDLIDKFGNYVDKYRFC